jgi:CMP-N,N'-diacetyllegionaminic acid synthase
MRILALVPARGGSKRLPGKNSRKLGGKPLIVWSIEVAAGHEDICDVLVSTDDAEIARLAESAGALVPWIRPAELAADRASSVDVALHALDWYERERGALDGLLLLQPTSPFRSKETLRAGIDKFRQSGGRAVLSVSTVPVHPLWTLRVENDRLVPFLDRHALDVRSQDLPPVFAPNGALYLIGPSDLRAHRSFFGGEAVPLVMDSPRETLDIDTEADWKLAEAMLMDN